MNNLATYRIFHLFFFAFALSLCPAIAQTLTLEASASKMEIAGTSNIHDWTMTAEEMEGTLELNEQNGVLEGIKNLQLTIPAESLKSGKGGMDKNTYKALDTKTHKNILYTLKSVKNIEKNGPDLYTISTSGNLTIAGVTKSVSITIQAISKPGVMTLKGTHKINMTDYKIDPPKALFGTITTGETVDINFETTFTK